MPWVLNKSYYIETDILKMEEQFISYYLKQVVEKYREIYQPDMTTMQPPIEEVLPLIEEYDQVRWVKTQFGKGGEQGRRKLELLKLLRPIVLQWGDYMVYAVESEKIYPFYVGFPYMRMDSLRRPASVSTYRVERNYQKGLTSMSCSKKPAMLLYFHWQASEDKVNWFTIGTTSQPKLTTKKLDREKRYFYRMYMTNPKGQSDFHFYRAFEAF